MSQLFFKKPFQDAIRAQQKKTTIRRWTRPMLRAGQVAFSPGLGWLAIEQVESVHLDELGDADAQADGFATASEMKRTLLELYPAHETDRKQWFRIRFSLQRPQLPRKRTADDGPSLFHVDAD